MSLLKFLIVFSMGFAFFSCSNEVKKDIAVTIGDTLVYQADLQKEFDKFVLFSTKISKGNTPAEGSELRQKMLKGYAKEVIDRTILLSWGKRKGVTIDKDKINLEYLKLKEDTASFNKIVSMQPMDSSEFKENFQRYLYLKKVMMIAYYDIFNKEFNFQNIHAAHILFLAPDSNLNSSKIKSVKDKILAKTKNLSSKDLNLRINSYKDSVKSFANSIYDSLNSGKSFSTLAKRYSQCPSASDGGDLGKFPSGTMKKEFEEAVINLKNGNFSKPIKTSIGYHLIKLLDTLEKEEIPLDSAGSDIAILLNDTKNQLRVIKALRDSVKVEIIWDKIK